MSSPTLFLVIATIACGVFTIAEVVGCSVFAASVI
jgi:hypothetical protein